MRAGTTSPLVPDRAITGLKARIRRWGSLLEQDPLMPKKQPEPTPSELATKIEDMAIQMMEVGVEMDYYGGLGEVGDHGRELCAAARIAKGWAENIRKLQQLREALKPAAKKGNKAKKKQ